MKWPHVVSCYSLLLLLQSTKTTWMTHSFQCESRGCHLKDSAQESFNLARSMKNPNQRWPPINIAKTYFLCNFLPSVLRTALNKHHFSRGWSHWRIRKWSTVRLKCSSVKEWFICFSGIVRQNSWSIGDIITQMFCILWPNPFYKAHAIIDLVPQTNADPLWNLGELVLKDSRCHSVNKWTPKSVNSRECFDWSVLILLEKINK